MQGALKKILTVFFLLIIVLPLQRCKQPYVSPNVSPQTGYLVIEGYISGNSPTSFQLSRTIKLSADTTSPQELGANVQVEGNDNSVYPLAAQGGGIYNTGALPLTPAVNYRLRVHTQSGGDYLSDYVPYKITPVIDSINWIQNNSGVTIYANAHDDAGATRYYQWSYDQTWEYDAAEYSHYKAVPDSHPVVIVPRPAAEQIFRCWRYSSSSEILINNSAKLAKDEIYRQPLRSITADSEPLSVLYSMLVRQYALTEDGYYFLSLMKKNTESLGSIFDAQPSALKGNIHCLSNPNELVIGFVSAGTVQEQRLFIDRSQISPWYYRYDCLGKDTVIDKYNLMDMEKFFGGGGFIPIDMSGISGWKGNGRYCIDCRAQGGVTDKPSYWPY